jgi:hypothetical protein
VGQRAIIGALRARLAQQQEVITTFKARDARLASVLRSLSYGRGGRGGAIPMGGMPFGSGGAGRSGSGGMSMDGLSGMGSPLATLAARFNPSTFAPAGLSTSGRIVGTPLGALTLNSGRREVASAIIHEAQRRGTHRSRPLPSWPMRCRKAA